MGPCEIDSTVVPCPARGATGEIGNGYDDEPARDSFDLERAACRVPAGIDQWYICTPEAGPVGRSTLDCTACDNRVVIHEA